MQTLKTGVGSSRKHRTETSHTLQQSANLFVRKAARKPGIMTKRLSTVGEEGVVRWLANRKVSWMNKSTADAARCTRPWMSAGLATYPIIECHYGMPGDCWKCEESAFLNNAMALEYRLYSSSAAESQFFPTHSAS